MFVSRGIDIPPKEIEKWRHELVSFRNTYVDYLNKTLGDAQAPQRHLQLRSEVIRQATPAQHILNRLGAQLSWLPPPAVGGPVLSGLINTAFIHEGPYGYAGSGLFGSGGQSYQAVIDLLDASIASLDRIEVEIRKSRRNPFYWGDRVLRALLGIPAYLISLVFQVPLSRIEDSVWGTALRIVTLFVEVGLLLLGLHEWFGWF
jgi:hypothetical protein